MLKRPDSLPRHLFKRNDDIQVLRALAILMVLAHHQQALFVSIEPSIFQQGLWAGVDLFFCISGYVITLSLMHRWSVQSLSTWQKIGGFWLARMWRIMPTMLVGLFMLLWMVSELYPDHMHKTKGDALAAALQWANIHFYRCDVLHISECGSGPIYWSLSLEFQFYLLLPIFFLCVPKKAWVPVLLLLMLVQMAIPHAHWADLLSFIRTDGFLMGVLIALWRLRSSAEKMSPDWLSDRRVNYAAFMLLVGLLSIVGNQHYKLIPNAMALTTLMAGIFVWIASYQRDYLLPPSRLKQMLVWIGDRSFAIYLLHHPIFHWVIWMWKDSVIAPKDSALYYVMMVLSAAALTLIAAELNFKFIEGALTSYGKRKLAGRRQATPV